MSFEQLIFSFFSLLLLCSAFMVITLRNPVHSALALIIAFIASSGLWLLLNAEFLALILILVYVGAVMTLFLFVVMTLNLNKGIQVKSFVRYLPYGIVVLISIAGLMIYALKQQYFVTSIAPMSLETGYSNIRALGEILYTTYAYPFELAGVLLLIAIVAAISLDLRIAKNKKQQKISEQMATNSKHQIRLVK